MEYVTIPMICAHAGKAPGTVLRALKVRAVPTERLPGAPGLRIELREANKFLRRQWPEAGPMPPEDVPAAGEPSALERKVMALEETSRELDLTDTAFFQAFLRLNAQLRALISLLGDFGQRLSIDPADLRGHFEERSNQFLDSMLLQRERENAAHAAELDDRQPEEIPTRRGFRPLFPGGG
jgi:hypothetical protein